MMQHLFLLVDKCCMENSLRFILNCLLIACGNLEICLMSSMHFDKLLINPLIALQKGKIAMFSLYVFYFAY